MGCATPRCVRDVPSPRSRWCRPCFCARARKAGSKGGAAVTGKAKRDAGRLSSGNRTVGKAKQDAGRTGGHLSSGNCTTGEVKKVFGSKGGKRSGLRRKAKVALVIKKPWLDKILSRQKTWEIRGCSTTRRGWVHLAQSRAGGKLVGCARLVGCRLVPRESFASHVAHHCVRNLTDVPHKKIYAWVLQDAARYSRPFSYKHAAGAVIWVRL